MRKINMARPVVMSEPEYRKHIVNTAKYLVITEGIGQLSMREIAKAAKTSVTQMYRKGIAGIEDIIFMLNEKTLDILIEHIAQIDLGQCDGEDGLRQLAAVYLEFSRPASEYYPLWELMQRLNADRLDSPVSYQQKTALLFSYGERAVQKAIPRLTGTELTEATRILWASIHGICHLHARDKLVSTGQSPINIMVKHLIHIFINGLRG
ncbi:TetR family transcriptional regulator [Piscirickettsia salmonis]|nr:TetR family transcriptional regulator [Piscirickettsia salmonis]ERL62262.1 bacterial regulatory s, tetR family protein [Piscirickettsia salmonis LF-89 = ATCC VR-1361]APS46271.1 TetR family transcriptional regulator [Piscirickettsia salmonis]APS50205.1 TetR family transcriptional regulator [Piscirickettsia salmonis]APS53407.1 TetR family transcriptional regulator [Piscirickettsia salmonis]